MMAESAHAFFGGSSAGARVNFLRIEDPPIDVSAYSIRWRRWPYWSFRSITIDSLVTASHREHARSIQRKVVNYVYPNRIPRRSRRGGRCAVDGTEASARCRGRLLGRAGIHQIRSRLGD